MPINCFHFSVQLVLLLRQFLHRTTVVPRTKKKIIAIASKADKEVDQAPIVVKTGQNRIETTILASPTKPKIA